MDEACQIEYRLFQTGWLCSPVNSLPIRGCDYTVRREDGQSKIQFDPFLYSLDQTMTYRRVRYEEVQQISVGVAA